MKTDPNRFCELGDQDPLAQLLLAGIEERPTQASRERTLSVILGPTAAVGAGVAATAASGKAAAASISAGGAMGTVGGITSAGAVATGAASLAPALGGGVAASSGAVQVGAATVAVGLAKWAGIGVVAIAATTHAPDGIEYLEHVWTPQPVVESTDQAPTTEASRPRLQSDAIAGGEPKLELMPRGELPATTELGQATPVVNDVRSAREVPKSSAPEKPSNVKLAQEVALLERSRSALQRGAPSEALRLLSSYETRFDERQLIVEVLVVRMEAAQALGRFEQSQELARRVLQLSGGGPYSARANAVLDSSR